MFLLSASKVHLNVLQRETVTSGSVNVYLVQFDFNSDWDGLDRTAVFQAGDDKISVVLDASNECQIPWEVLENPRRTLEAGVYGTKGGDVVLPTIWASLGTIREGASMGTNAQPPTPDVYSQILDAANSAEKIAQSVRDDADAGKFDGEPGPAGLQGPPGEGVPEGGTEGQILSKTTDGTAWVDPPQSGVQPDWNQNDPEAADYVKNRPGYVIPDFTFLDGTITTTIENTLTGEVAFGTLSFDSLNFPASGSALQVIINGNSYDTFVRTVDVYTVDISGVSCQVTDVGIGNLSLMGPGPENTGESFLMAFEKIVPTDPNGQLPDTVSPFTVLFYIDSQAGDYAVKVIGDKYEPLPIEYLTNVNEMGFITMDNIMQGWENTGNSNYINYIRFRTHADPNTSGVSLEMNYYGSFYVESNDGSRGNQGINFDTGDDEHEIGLYSGVFRTGNKINTAIFSINGENESFDFGFSSYVGRPPRDRRNIVLSVNESKVESSVPVQLPGNPTEDLQAAPKQYVDALKPKPITITLPASGWSNNQQTVTATGVTADNAVTPSPAPESWEAAGAAGVRCTAQGADSLTFACSETPTEDLTYNVLIQEVQ